MTNLIAVLAIAVTALIAAFSWYQGRKEAERQTAIKYREAQLRDLYGPLLMQRLRSEANRSLLPEDDSHPEAQRDIDTAFGRWRLVNHIGSLREAWELKQAGKDHPYTLSEIYAAESIIKNGDRMIELIITQAGLFELPRSNVYQQYVEHHEHLRMSWLSKTNQPYGQDSKPFPGGRAGLNLEDRLKDETTREHDLDCAIRIDERRIRYELDRLREPHTPVWSRFLSWIGLTMGTIVVISLAVYTFWTLATQPTENEDKPSLLVETDSGIRCATIIEGKLQVDGNEIADLNNAVVVDSC